MDGILNKNKQSIVREQDDFYSNRDITHSIEVQWTHQPLHKNILNLLNKKPTFNSRENSILFQCQIKPRLVFPHT